MNNNQPSIVQRISSRIDMLRTQQNLTFRNLAKRSGISLSTLYDIIQGNKIPNILTLESICNALNISLSDFLDFNEDVFKLRGKEPIVIKIFREVSPMSQDTIIKVLKCMK